MKIKYEPVQTAEMFIYLREAGPNRGRRIEGVQWWALGAFGDSWCDEFGVGFILDICFQGKSPFPRTTEINASTPSTLEYAKQQGWIVNTPERGDLVFSVDPTTGKAHHVAFCVSFGPLVTIAGNTSEDGKSSNGDRVATHEVSTENKVYVHYPREVPD